MRFKFSIRLLLGLTLFASIGIACYANSHWRFQRRLSAMSRIEKVSGHLSYRKANGGLAFEVNDEVRRYDRIESIYLAGSSLDNATLEGLKLLDDVQKLSFNSSTFCDEHVAFLDTLSNLQEVQLNGTSITRRGLERLALKHSLTMLTLNDTSIDDESVAVLGAMKSLKKLQLRKTRVSAEGIESLRKLLPHCTIDR